MPKNQVCKLADGRFSYKWTDKKSGEVKRLVSHKSEKIQAFKQRCADAEDPNKVTIDMTFGQLYKKWREDYQKLNCGPADLATVKYNYVKFVEKKFGHIKICEINRSDINSLLAEAAKKGYARTVLDKIRACFTRPYNYAINELDLRIYNPADKIRLPKKPVIQDDELGDVEEGQRFISSRDMDRFFEAAVNSWFYQAFELMSLTGMRPSEILGLKWEDINKMIRPKRAITDYGLGPLKSKAAKRTIPITPAIIDCLWRQYQTCDEKNVLVEWVFPESDGGRPTMNSLRLSFQRARNQTKIWKKVDRKYHGELISDRVDFSMYDFRHTFATFAATRMAPKQLQHIMGHANIETTLQIYAGLTSEQRAEAGTAMEEMWLVTASAL